MNDALAPNGLNPEPRTLNPFPALNPEPRTLTPFVCLLLALLAAGCRRAGPQFRLNMEGRPPESVSQQQAKAITEALTGLFGTPDEPKVSTGVDLDLELLRRASGPIAGAPGGQERGLFRRQCVTCHGVSGDGAGPTAAELDPYPRDFRNGVFKYTSTRGGVKPIMMDLRRTLYRGVAGTAMPSFAQLPEEEIDALLEYVKYFGVRGQTELYLFQMVVDDDGALPLDQSQVMEEGVLPAAQSWFEPERRRAELVAKPPPRPPTDTPERLATSIAKGRELYLSTNSQCTKCHGPEGNGQGEQSELYDDWNKRKKGETPERTAELARFFTLPIERLRPRNLHEGVFRGGGTPIDLYRRVCVGIKGTPMPAAGSAPGVPGVLSDEEVWQVVEYVRSLGGSRQ